jgi:hypothetical protein
MLAREADVGVSTIKVSAMRRVFGDALVSIGTLVVLLLALVSVDARVRERVSNALFNPSLSELADTGSQLRDLSMVVFSAAKDQSVEHAPLMIFAAAATVLVLFMVRT